MRQHWRLRQMLISYWFFTMLLLAIPLNSVIPIHFKPRLPLLNDNRFNFNHNNPTASWSPSGSNNGNLEPVMVLSN